MTSKDVLWTKFTVLLLSFFDALVYSLYPRLFCKKFALVILQNDLCFILARSHAGLKRHE